jgi:hypothetical protein
LVSDETVNKCSSWRSASDDAGYERNAHLFLMLVGDEIISTSRMLKGYPKKGVRPLRTPFFGLLPAIS